MWALKRWKINNLLVLKFRAKKVKNLPVREACQEVELRWTPKVLLRATAAQSLTTLGFLKHMI